MDDHPSLRYKLECPPPFNQFLWSPQAEYRERTETQTVRKDTAKRPLFLSPFSHLFISDTITESVKQQ